MGDVECDHVAKLVPEHRLPVGIVTNGRGWAIGGDDIPKTNPEKTWIVRHAKGSHPKITLIGKHFDNDGVIQVKIVFIAEGCLCLCEQ